MPRPKPTPTPKKASGENIEEWQRHGCKIQYRLDEDASDALDAEAMRYRMTPNAYAKLLLLRHLGLPSEAEEREERVADALYERRND